MNKKIISGLLVILLTRSLYGGGFSSLWLGGGARISAMGGAGSAAARGAAAGFYNAAALSLKNGSSFVFSSYKWVGNLSGAFASYGTGNNKSGFGIFGLFSSIGDIQYRTVPSEEPISTFSFYEASAGVSYSRRIRDNLSAGVTLKGFYTKIFIHESAGFGFDLGLMWKPEKMPLIFGFTVQNIGKMSTLNLERVELPVFTAAGFSLPFKCMGQNALITADFVYDKEEDFCVKSGFELDINKFLFIRAGYRSGSEIYGFSAGAGLSWQRYLINYSYMPYSNQWHDMHKFSIELSL
ncbi:hypothetical protein DRQ07_00795 [candidate division KSB1 bacterium]|nr:MAG: hypothetical protein DRQ07_00795 [candidate division KSB1 bacterium]